MKKLNFLAIMLLSSLLVTGCNTSSEGTSTNTNTSISDIYESHNISFSTSESYIVHCEISSAKKDETVSFEVELLFSYLSVNEVTVNEQQIALTNDNKYSFVMPDEDVFVQINVTDTRVQQKTPNEVIASLAEKRNYTLTIDDKIFNTVITDYYTENAFYSTYSKDNQQYGLAEDNEGYVFGFTLSETDVIPEQYSVDKNGNKISGLWANSIVSFADINPTLLPSEPNLDNTYEITDSYNKLILSTIAGYGDMYVQDYLTISCVVKGDLDIEFIVHFNSDNEKYNGDCIITLSNLDQTVIPFIDEYLSAGGKGKLDASEEISNVLKNIKESNNYSISVYVNEANTYNDYFTNNYFYSENVNTISLSKGHVYVAEGIYNFTINNNNVVAGSEITYTAGDDRTLWANSSNTFKNLSTLNLANLTVTTLEDGTNQIKGILQTLFDIAHPSGFFPTANETNDIVTVNEYDNEHFNYTYVDSDGSTYVVNIHNVGSTKIDCVDQFIESKKDFDSTDSSKLLEILNNLKTSHQYKATSISKSSWPVSTTTVLVTFLEDSYSVNSSVENASYSYNIEEGIVVKNYVDSEGNNAKEPTEFTDLWSSNLFNSFISFDETYLQGTSQTLDGAYKVTSKDLITLFFNVSLASSSLLSSVSSATIIIDETNKVLTLSASAGFSGSVEINIQY